MIENSRGRRRLINAVLRHQLEILYKLKRSDPGDILPTLRALIEEKYPGQGSQIDAVVATVPEFAAKLHDLFEESIDEEVVRQYNTAIDSLGEDEPVLAYRLTGVDRLVPLTKHIEDFVSFAAPFDPTTPPVEVLRRAFKPELYRLASASVEDDIKMMKPFLTRRHKRELNESIQRLQERALLKKKEDIDDYWQFMDKVFARVAADPMTTRG